AVSVTCFSLLALMNDVQAQNFTFNRSKCCAPKCGFCLSVSSPAPDKNSSTVSSPQAQGPPANDAGELAKKLSNPVASLISVPFQSNFDFRMGTGSGWRYTMNFQPVIPFALNPKWNVISRTIVPIIHQSNVTSPGASQSGLGD